MNGTVDVEHVIGDQFRIAVRDHEIVVDQPNADGPGAGPTPTELFVAALASCIAFYAERYLARHQLPIEGLRTTADYTIGGRPARVERVSIRLHIPDGVPKERLPGLLAVASHCTVHNSLQQTPDVTIDLAADVAVPRQT